MTHTKFIISVLFYILCTATSYSQSFELCANGATIRSLTDPEESYNWYAVEQSCGEFRTQGACDSRRNCVWLVQICVANSLPDSGDVGFTTDFCAREADTR